MANKKKLIEMDPKHKEWLKRTAQELRLYEKDVIFQVFENAMKTNVMESFKKRAVTSELQRNLDQLAMKGKEIAALQERSERLLRQAEEADGK